MICSILENLILQLGYQNQLTIFSCVLETHPFTNNCGTPTMCLTLSTFHVEIVYRALGSCDVVLVLLRTRLNPEGVKKLTQDSMATK